MRFFAGRARIKDKSKSRRDEKSAMAFRDDPSTRRNDVYEMSS